MAIMMLCDELKATVGRLMYWCGSPKSTDDKGDFMKY